ncbi:low-density lipoprotein receptor-related protein 1-like [Patiria miniata]|uniref:CUB domain-containing protein n=1 Tax=Patiria miniata TaxID=46514 RepID=A0A914BRQ2_PATMI|nr:low-density lipoprotein receptor-related protein 1-like [Patiria miniata]
MVGSTCVVSYTSTEYISSSRGALVYSMIGSQYSVGTCYYIFYTADDGRLLVDAEKMGLDGTGACLNFEESSDSSFNRRRQLARYCGNTLFQVNTTKRYLKIKFDSSSYTDQAEFRLVVSPFFEGGVSIETFNCDDGYNISKDMRSDGHQNCPDNSDEKGASALPCSSRMLSCGESGPCIAKDWKCDRIPDCPNASDEEGCIYKCPGSSSNGESYQLECQDKSGCFSQYERCRGNSYSECDDGSANKYCDACDGYNDYYYFANEPRFDSYCPMTRTCMTAAQLCDGTTDCPNGADEEYNLCHPSIYWYWTGGQLAGLFIGFIIFAVVVVVIVAVVHKKCRKQVG